MATTQLTTEISSQIAHAAATRIFAEIYRFDPIRQERIEKIIEQEITRAATGKAG